MVALSVPAADGLNAVNFNSMIIDRVAVTISVIGQKPEVRAFLKMCQAIQYCGNIGASRTVKVDVDGDGSGRLSFKSESGKSIPSFPFDDDTLEIDIGE